MKFHFYNDESIQPDIYDKTDRPLDLPLVATTIRQRVEQLPLVILSLRARHLDLVTCDKNGWPQVLLHGHDLVDLLEVSKVRYESGDVPGSGLIHLEIELGPNDEATVE